MKLSIKTMESAKPAEEEYMLPDGDKLYLRVQPKGLKSWLFLYSDIVGRRVKLTVGAYLAMSDGRPDHSVPMWRCRHAYPSGSSTNGRRAIGLVAFRRGFGPYVHFAWRLHLARVVQRSSGTA